MANKDLLDEIIADLTDEQRAEIVSGLLVERAQREQEALRAEYDQQFNALAAKHRGTQAGYDKLIELKAKYRSRGLEGI